MALDQNSRAMGIAGTNTLDLADMVHMGIAGRFGSTLRPVVHSILEQKPMGKPSHKSKSTRETLGDKALRAGWKHAVYLTDYSFVTCPDEVRGGMRWRKNFRGYFDQDSRRLPLIFDSAAFRSYNGAADPWTSYKHYTQAIEMARPDAAMALDIIGDQAATRRNYERMQVDGFGGLTIPVWQAPALYDRSLSPWDNGILASRDETLRWFATQAPMVAIGGLLATTNREFKGPRVIPVAERAEYVASIVEHMPGVRFWALGQASGQVVNGLGQRGVLDRVSVDGTWWILNARCEKIIVRKDGALHNIELAGTGMESYLTFMQLLSCSLLALLSAYAGMLDFPGAAVVPTNMRDRDEARELIARVQQLQMWEGAA